VEGDGFKGNMIISFPFYIFIDKNYNINTFNSLGTVNIKIMVRIKLFINQKNINL